MKGEPTPLELAIDKDAPVPNLSPDDVYRLLTSKVRRGYFICRSLFWISAIAAGAAMVGGRSPLAIVGFLLTVLFGTCANLFQNKLGLARKMSVAPELIFW